MNKCVLSMEWPSMLLLEAFLIGQELNGFEKGQNYCTVTLGHPFPHVTATNQAPSVDSILNEPWPYWVNSSFRAFHSYVLLGILPELLLPLQFCIFHISGIWEVSSKYYCQWWWQHIHIRPETNIFSLHIATLIQMKLHWLPFSSLI